EGEEIDDEQRSHDERAEDRDRPCRESRPGDVIAVVADELPELARKERRERNDPDQVEQQHPRLQAAELTRGLNALGQKEQCAGAHGDPQQYERNATPALQKARGYAYTGSDHEYHSLVRCQSFVQNMIARNDAGSRPRRTPARTLTRYRPPSSCGSTRMGHP